MTVNVSMQMGSGGFTFGATATARRAASPPWRTMQRPAPPILPRYVPENFRLGRPRRPAAPVKRTFKKGKEPAVPPTVASSLLDRNREALLGNTDEECESQLARPVKVFLATALNQVTQFVVTERDRLKKWRADYVKAFPNQSVMEMVVALRSAFPRQHAGAGTRILSGLDDAMKKVLSRKIDALEFEAKLESITPVQSSSSTDNHPVCAICTEAYLQGNVVQCGAGHTACKPCYYRYITATLQGQATKSAIKCFQPNCALLYPESLVENNLPAERLQKMEQKERAVALQASQSEGTAQGTLVCKCGVVATIEGEDARECAIACKCGKQYCLKCNNEAHEGLACGETGDSKTQAASIEWITQHAKPCPRCKTPIEKNGGCVHMTCARIAGGCGYEFCWVCMANWKPVGRPVGECLCVQRRRATLRNRGPAPMQQ